MMKIGKFKPFGFLYRYNLVNFKYEKIGGVKVRDGFT